jgi:hypothetical protein
MNVIDFKGGADGKAPVLERFRVRLAATALTPTRVQLRSPPVPLTPLPPSPPSLALSSAFAASCVACGGGRRQSPPLISLHARERVKRWKMNGAYA